MQHQHINGHCTLLLAGNYGELAMITLPLPVRARFVILGIVSFDKNPCLKVQHPLPSIRLLFLLSLFQFELMGCEDVPPQERHLGFNNGFPICVDNEPPAFRCYLIEKCFFAQFNLANWQIIVPRWRYSQPHTTHSGTALPTRSWCKSRPMAFSFPSTSHSPLLWITLEVLRGLMSSQRVSPFP